MLSDRSLGWLRHLDRKATTADRWNRHGYPHPHWDGGRADLLDSASALALTAQRTPAWTERHVTLLDELISRHTAWWSLAGWLEAGGGEPRDPVGADGTIGWAGSLLVLLGLRAVVAAADQPDRWNKPFALVGEGGPDGGGFPSTHSTLARAVARQWAAGGPDGPTDDDGAVWPGRLVTAGLGLQLHDRRHGTDLHATVFEPWWAQARTRFFGLGEPSDGPPASVTLRLDPVTGATEVGSVVDALLTAAHLAPQAADDARRLFDAGYAALTPVLDRISATAGESVPAPEVGPAAESALSPDQAEAAGAALLLARDWGLRDEANRLAAAIEGSYRSMWDEERGEHTWAPAPGDGADDVTGAGAAWGRADAWLAAAEAAGPGLWTGLAAAPWAPCHQVVGVDAPAVLLRRAEWISEALHVTLTPRRDEPGRWTTFRITGAEPRMWYFTGLSGTTMDTAGNATIVRVPLQAGDLEFAPGSY